MAKVNLGQEPNMVEREVKGAFGNFFIQIRTPSVVERARIRNLLIHGQWDELSILRHHLVQGWREMLGTDDQPIAFNDQNYERVCACNPSIEQAITSTVAAFLDEDLTAVAAAAVTG